MRFYKHLRFITKLVGLVVLVVAGLLFIAARNPRFKESLQTLLVRVAEKNMQAQCTFTIENINPFFLSVTLADVVLQPFDQVEGWQCTCKKIEVGVSFFASLAHGKVAADVVVSNARIFSPLERWQVVLLAHLEKVFALPAQLPCFLHTLSIDVLTCVVDDNIEKNFGTITCSLAFQSNDRGHKIECELLEGAGAYKGKPVFADIRGMVAVQRTKEGAWLCAPECVCTLPMLPAGQNSWHLAGTWIGSRGTFFVHNQDKSLMISPCLIALCKEGIEISLGALVPLSYGAYFLSIPYADKATGRCNAQIVGTIGKTIKGELSLVNVGMGTHTLESVKTSFTLEGNNARGLCIYEEAKQSIALDWVWDGVAQQLRFVGGNTTPITLFGSLWQIPASRLYVKGKLHSSLQGSWSYALFMEQEKTEHCFAAQAQVQCNGYDFVHTGTVYTNEREYFLDVRNAPFSISLSEQGQTEAQPAVVVATTADNHLEGSFDAVFLQNLCKEYLSVDLFAQGRCSIVGQMQQTEFRGSIVLDDGMVRKSPLYNFIQSLSAEFAIDFLKRTGSLTNIFIGLQKGFLQSSCVCGGYDTQHQQWWYHAPLTFADCFINWKKDLYVLASGAFIAQKKYTTTPFLEGFLLFDTAHLKENIFSQEVQQQLLSSSVGASVVGCDLCLSVVTRTPLIVKTPQLETKVYVDLLCKGAITKPEISGTLALEGGMLHFSAYSLPIVKGIVLCDGATLDPRIELIAQGRIKKYRVTLSVTGTAQDPHIMFDAYPWLSQEQIMMLLIAGSEEESLNILAPALVMRTIENSIFGSSYRTPADSWLASLRRIKFVPRFMDQTGRGGFKGSIEIEVNNRLRASIEKNFSLTEDVAFEVQYAITDDVSIRGGVDERGDLGAELEMRCKF